MVSKSFRRIILILALICLSVSLFAETPWYEGQPIAEFENTGLINVKPEVVDTIEKKYRGQNYSDDLFNKLQAELYDTNSFLYFLGTAEKNTVGGLKIIFEFVELPWITEVNLQGVVQMKESKVKNVLTTKVGDFFLNKTLSDSIQAVKNLYLDDGYEDVQVEANQTENESSSTCAVTFTITEGVRKKIKNINFEGNEHFEASALKKQLTSKQSSYKDSGAYKQGNLEKDKSDLLTFYQNNGYMEAKVTDVKVEELPKAEDSKSKDMELSVTYVIEEGTQWLFGGLNIVGNTVFSTEELQTLVTMKQGDVIDMSKIQTILENVASKYWDNGYVHSATDVQENRDDATHTISYTMTINENNQATISEIRLEGLTKTKANVFMREMAFKVGDVFSRAKFQKSAQNIYNTLIVTDVQMDLVDGKEPNTVVPIFKVTEGNQMTIQFGATFGGTVDSFPISAFVQWSDKNVAGTGRDLSISTTLSPDTQSVSMSFGDDWVGDKRWSNVLSFNFSRESKTNGLQKGAKSPGYYTGHDTDDFHNQPYPLGYDSYLDYLASSQANPSSRYLMPYTYYRISLGYTSGYTFMFDAGSLSLSGGLNVGLNRAYYDSAKYDPFEYLMTLYHDNWQWSNKLLFNMTWDGRDLVENTTKGYMISNQLTYAGGILSGLSNYLKESLSLSWYVSPFKYKLGEKDAPVVIGMTTAVNWMLPQFWNNNYSELGGSGWGWYNPKVGATRYEMLYIDGMNIGRGFDVIYDQSFLWNNEVSLGAPLVINVLNWEIFASATGIVSQYDTVFKQGFGSINWYFALGAGIKLKIPGFPLGLYLVKNAEKLSGEDITWVGGTIFSNGDTNSGLKLVLAITQTIY